MIQAIVFDFGNVLGFFDYDLTVRNLAPHSSLPPEVIRREIYGGELEDAYERGRLTSEEFLARLRQVCRLRCSDEELVAGYVDMFWRNEEVCRLIPRLARAYRLVLGSNTTELHSRHFRRHFADALRHFQGLVLSHEVGARKPRPEFYARCVLAAGCPPRDCLFIDDLPANVAGAEACGLKGLLYRPGEDLAGQLLSLGVRLRPEPHGP